MTDPRTYKRRIAKIREKGLHWEPMMMFAAFLEREDTRKLVLHFQWQANSQKYFVFAVEAGDVESINAVFEDHGHHDLGSFDTEQEAKKVCRDYAIKWWEQSAAIDACDCEPL